MNSGADAPEIEAKVSLQSESRAIVSGESTQLDVIPAPDEEPRAPKNDLVTVRVRVVNTGGRMANYFSARAYEAGVEIGHVNASTRESALAGGMAIVQTVWANRATRQTRAGEENRDE